LDEGGLEAVTFGVILTPSNLPIHQRLLMLHTDLNKLLAGQHPDTCAVEKLFFQRNVSTAIAVGEARGVAMLAIAEAGLDVAEYTPNEVKQAVAGYGSAEKRQVQEMVRTLLGLPEIPKPDDAADALAIAITHLNTKHY
jgi:crossover junction endodeoxyribonuclease RuvC